MKRRNVGVTDLLP